MRRQGIFLICFATIPNQALGACFDFTKKIERGLKNSHSVFSKSVLKSDDVLQKSGASSSDGPVWAAVRGRIHHSVQDILEDLKKHQATKSGSASEMVITPMDNSHFDLHQKVQYAVNPFPFVKIRWTEDWAFSVLKNKSSKAMKASVPERVLVSYEKTEGTSHIQHLCGNIELIRLDDHWTEIFIYEEAKATRRSQLDTLNGIRATLIQLRKTNFRSPSSSNPVSKEDRSGTEELPHPMEPPPDRDEKPKTPDDSHEDTRTKIIPLPIYATLPNEGSTWGFMPVFIQVKSRSERTESIYAPSISWNQIIKTTATARWYYYPKENQNLTFTGSVSSHVNWGTFISWQNLPFNTGATTEEVTFRVQRSIFFRFFGIGPETLNNAETSHTRLRGSLVLRKGLNLPANFNVGLVLEGARDLVQRESVPGLPLSPDQFPNVPGMGSGGTIIGESLDLRFDTRVLRDYSTEGWYSNLIAGIFQGIANSPFHYRVQFHAKGLIPEGNRLQLGARFLWRYVSSPQVPFYYQSSLGGSYLLRGYTEDRFIDQGAWLLEFEQRFRVFQTHIYGVTTDWRIDPFIAIGQVYHDFQSILSKVRVTGGLGFRALVRPNVLGRVDVATAGDGPQFYVEIGYPF